VPTALSKNHDPVERLALVFWCSGLIAQLDFARGQSPASLFIFADIVIPNEVEGSAVRRQDADPSLHSGRQFFKGVTRVIPDFRHVKARLLG